MTTDSLRQSQTIDSLRPLLAIMVVALHVRPYFVAENILFTDGLFEASVITIFRILFSLAVPAFFLISGYLFFNNLKDWDTAVWKGKMTKRIRTILVPYILWNAIAIVGFVLTRCLGCIFKANEIPDIVGLVSERGFLRLFWDRSLFGQINEDAVNILGMSVGGGTPIDAPAWFLRDLMIVLLFSPLVWLFVKKCGRLFIALSVCLYLVDIWIPFCGFSSKAFCLFSIGAWMNIKGLSMVEESGRHPVFLLLLSMMFMFAAAFFFGRCDNLYTITSRLFILVGVPLLIHVVSMSQIERFNVVNRLSHSSFFVYVAHTILVVDVICWLIQSFFKSDNQAVSFLLLCMATFVSYITCHLIWSLMKRFMPRVLCVLTGSRL